MVKREYKDENEDDLPDTKDALRYIIDNDISDCFNLDVAAERDPLDNLIAKEEAQEDNQSPDWRKFHQTTKLAKENLSDQEHRIFIQLQTRSQSEIARIENITPQRVGKIVKAIKRKILGARAAV